MKGMIILFKRIFILLFSIMLISSCSPSGAVRETLARVNPSPSPSPTAEPTPSPSPSPTPEPVEREGLDELKSQLSSYTQNLDGSWGIYVKNLKSGEYLSINEHEMYSASLIKLFIMGAVYNEIACGSITKDENVENLLRLMITESDNNASNELCIMMGGGDALKGFEVENAHTRSIDCTYTKQQTDLQDNRANSIVEYIGRNYTSPRDCGHLLELVYKGKLVSESASAEMLALLKDQHTLYKIPAGLPEGTVCANKTGEMSSVENDAAIIYSPACDYILTVMSNDAYNTDRSAAAITEISRTVYAYFNP